MRRTMSTSGRAVKSGHLRLTKHKPVVRSLAAIQFPIEFNELSMRNLIVLGALAGAVLLPAPAWAESHVFIIANNADGYGVDRCLAAGESCGKVVATAYCQAREFADARSFRKVEADEITGATTAADEACRTGCDEYVAIECTR